VFPDECNCRIGTDDYARAKLPRGSRRMQLTKRYAIASSQSACGAKLSKRSDVSPLRVIFFAWIARTIIENDTGYCRRMAYRAGRCERPALFIGLIVGGIRVRSAARPS
jgi:hypothetical protein